jgi:hypothetical protein
MVTLSAAESSESRARGPENLVPVVILLMRPVYVKMFDAVFFTIEEFWSGWFL